jgi:SAM-dependent methyltransferase
MANFHETVRSMLLARLQAPASIDQLTGALRLLGKYRAQLLQNEMVRRHGIIVQGGPFQGMVFRDRSAEGCHLPKLLGCYEAELHPFILSVPDAGYETILNIGCAEGYYAVGLKRLAPATRVIGRDTDPNGLALVTQIAAANGVEVETGGFFVPGDFSGFAGQRVLVWCDIEGAEADLLDPSLAPALRGMDLVVETHPDGRGGATLPLMLERFSPSHDTVVLHGGVRHVDLAALIPTGDELDRLLAGWEWRQSPTPWLIARAREPAGKR